MTRQSVRLWVKREWKLWIALFVIVNLLRFNHVQAQVIKMQRKEMRADIEAMLDAQRNTMSCFTKLRDQIEQQNRELRDWIEQQKNQGK